MAKFKTWGADHTTLLNLGRYGYVQYNHGGAAMGRCGGGWLFKFGIMGGPTSVVIELTWITIRIVFRPEKKS
jgi:hypothetical protein